MAIAPDRPDWRWNAVTTLLDYSHMKALTLVQRMDELTQKVYKFRRQFKDRLINSLPDYVNAHEIWIQRPFQRAVLEGLLVGGATDDIIQQEMEIGKDDIAAYVAMFFDIRGRRRMDVSNMVFQGMPHKGYHPNDKQGVMLRLGWFGGYRLIQSILAQGLNEESAQSYCAEVCQDLIRRQLPEMGLSAGYQAELAPEYLKIVTAWDAKKAGGSQGELENTLDVMIKSGVTLSVADTSDPANLRLPAQEPRYIEALEVHDATHV